jgi:hypothetical protein
MLTAIFVAHPRQVGESYLAHARTAAGFGLAMLAGGAACLVHAVVPALFTSTGSDTVRRLHRAMAARRREAAEGLCYCI